MSKYLLLRLADSKLCQIWSMRVETIHVIKSLHYYWLNIDINSSTWKNHWCRNQHSLRRYYQLQIWINSTNSEEILLLNRGCSRACRNQWWLQRQCDPSWPQIRRMAVTLYRGETSVIMSLPLASGQKFLKQLALCTTALFMTGRLQEKHTSLRWTYRTVECDITMKGAIFFGH